jgi:hypothetical protein
MYYNGGSIIMVQVENEYGHYSNCSASYMEHLAHLFRSVLGQEAVLTSVDNPDMKKLKCGNGVTNLIFATVDFSVGSNFREAFAVQRRFNKGTGPFVNVECWTAWFDQWGGRHATMDAAKYANYLDQLLAYGANVNMYAAVGGSDPGWNNGMELNGMGQTGSYDFDAPISECLDLRWKYELIKNVIAKYKNTTKYDVKNNTKKAYGEVDMSKHRISLLDALPYITDRNQHSSTPLTFEDLEQEFGFVLYRTKLEKRALVDFGTVYDRAYVMIDRKLVTILPRGHSNATELGPGNLDVLVENEGRFSFGFNPSWVTLKGLIDGVTVDGKPHLEWDHVAIGSANVSTIKFDSYDGHVPAFFRGVFTIQGEPEDTFFNPIGWEKGNVYVNGHHLQRYWLIGPQLTVYVPKWLLHEGVNEVIILELEKPAGRLTVQFDDHPVLDYRR